MLGAIWGSILLLFGLVIIGYTIYHIIVNRPSSTADWVFQVFYLITGLIICYYGYQSLYPPQPSGIFGGRRR